MSTEANIEWFDREFCQFSDGTPDVILTGFGKDWLERKEDPIARAQAMLFDLYEQANVEYYAQYGLGFTSGADYTYRFSEAGGRLEVEISSRWGSLDEDEDWSRAFPDWELVEARSNCVKLRLKEVSNVRS